MYSILGEILPFVTIRNVSVFIISLLCRISNHSNSLSMHMNPVARGEKSRNLLANSTGHLLSRCFMP